MIDLKRDRTAATVKAKYRNPKRIENGVDLIKGFMTGENKFYKDDFWKLSKDQLKAESSGKCGFCETPTSASYFGDVEHFRPKQRAMYWWLAYCIDNYLFSCRICNGFRSDQFPIRGTMLTAPVLPANPTDAQLTAIADAMTPDPLDTVSRDAFDAECLAEQAFLPNPYQQDPWSLFKWEAIDAIEEVNIAPRDQASTAVAERAIDILELNRDELRAQRYGVYELLEGFKDIFELSNGPEKTIAENKIKKMMAGKRPYCGMARFFVSEEWQLGIPLPN